jgi:tetratricopeptide (TPR) repeat protein
MKLFSIFLLLLLVLPGVPVQASGPAELAPIDAEAMSGDPDRIRKAIDAYQKLDRDDAEYTWRLLRAYFNYYDELTDRNRRDDQKWAADTGYPIAVKALKKYPDHPAVIYYYATTGLYYLDFHRVKALFVINDLLAAFEKVHGLDPDIDDGGPDRNLGFLYHELPGWPLGKGDKKKALFHFQEAVRLAPERAANRLPYAKVLAELKRYDEGWGHIVFVRSDRFKASSRHWHEIYLKRVEEVAGLFPQNKKN